MKLKRKYRIIISLSLLLISSFIVQDDWFGSDSNFILVFLFFLFVSLFLSVVIIGLYSVCLILEHFLERMINKFFLPDIESLDVFYFICFLMSIMIHFPELLIYVWISLS